MATKKDRPLSKQQMNTNTYIVGAVIVTVLIVGACAFFANSLLGSVVLNTKVINGENTAVNDLKTKLNNAPNLINAYHQLGSQKDLIQHALPTTSDFPEIVVIAESMAAQANVTLKSVAPSGVAGAPTPGAGSAGAPASASGTPGIGSLPQPTQYQFSVSITGPYNQVLQFLSAIETSARPIRATSAQLSGTGSSITADLELTTYYQDKADITDKTKVVK